MPHPPRCSFTTWSLVKNGRPLGIFVAVALAIGACSNEFVAQQSNGDTTATLKAGTYPLGMGRNVLQLQLADRTGGRLPDDALVEVRYGLPPMPGMGTVSRVAELSRNGEGYEFSADIHTKATWSLDVVIHRSGRPDSKLTFQLKAL